MHRKLTERTILNEIGEMNRVPVIVWNNPEELELDEGAVPVDPASFISGNSQIINAQTSEDEEELRDIMGTCGEA